MRKATWRDFPGETRFLAERMAKTVNEIIVTLLPLTPAQRKEAFRLAGKARRVGGF